MSDAIFNLLPSNKSTQHDMVSDWKLNPRHCVFVPNACRITYAWSTKLKSRWAFAWRFHFVMCDCVACVWFLRLRKTSSPSPVSPCVRDEKLLFITILCRHVLVHESWKACNERTTNFIHIKQNILAHIVYHGSVHRTHRTKTISGWILPVSERLLYNRTCMDAVIDVESGWLG